MKHADKARNRLRPFTRLIGFICGSATPRPHANTSRHNSDHHVIVYRTLYFTHSKTLYTRFERTIGVITLIVHRETTPYLFTRDGIAKTGTLLCGIFSAVAELSDQYTATILEDFLLWVNNDVSHVEVIVEAIVEATSCRFKELTRQKTIE